MKYVVGAALAAFLLSSAANAAVVFNVNGSFTQNAAAAGTLTGTFTTNDALTQVTGINLTSSAFGAFQQTVYNDIAAIDFQGLPNAFRLTITQTPVKQLQLAFSPALTAVGGTFTGNSFEAQQIISAGNRLLSGTAVAQVTTAVPEPATWAMMLVGFGGIGFAMRRKSKVTTNVAFA